MAALSTRGNTAPEEMQTFKNITLSDRILGSDQDEIMTKFLIDYLPSIYAKINNGVKPLNDKISSCLATTKNLEAYAQAVYEKLWSIDNSTQIEFIDMAAYVYRHFNTLGDARKLIQSMTIKENKINLKSLNELREMVEGSFPQVIIGEPILDKHAGSKRDTLFESLASLYSKVPIYELLERYGFRNEIGINAAIEYFGPENVISLTQEKFWDNFSTMEELSDYIDEDPNQLGKASDLTAIMNAYDSHTEMFKGLMKCLDPKLRIHLGYIGDAVPDAPDDSFCNNLILDLLRKLKVHNTSTGGKRHETSVKIIPYAKDGNNVDFLKWVENVLNFQQDPTFLEEGEEYWSLIQETFSYNFQEVDSLNCHLAGQPIVDKASCVKFMKKLTAWHTTNVPKVSKYEGNIGSDGLPAPPLLPGNSSQPARNKRKREYDDETNQYERTAPNRDAQFTTRKQICDLMRNVYPGKVYSQLWLVKSTMNIVIDEIHKEFPNLCKVCCIFSHDFEMETCEHQGQDCPVHTKLHLGSQNLPKAFEKGNLWPIIERSLFCQAKRRKELKIQA